MKLTCFMSHEADGAINDNIVFIMLRLLLRDLHDFWCQC